MRFSKKLQQKKWLLDIPKGWYNVTLPELTDNLKALLVKTSGAIKVEGQKFPRYETNQPLEIHSLNNSQAISTKMLNISYGGLQCSFMSESEFKMGDYVRLNIKLNELNKTHSLNAKVVWVEDKKQASKKMGLAFVSNQDMYTKMLNYV
jgi:Tfp pilus assembly protein PilZ